jgi:hypothetical protein
MTEPPTIVTGIRPGLDVRTVSGCAGRQIPVADWLCSCGHHERASGSATVHALTARARIGRCSHQQEARP